MPTHTSRLALIEQIDALLPQTQCGKCGTPNCRSYAEAIADGTPINRCVPGGAATITDLAVLTGQAIQPLDPAFGIEPVSHRVAWIRENECIGCTKCIQACPVDAIVGAAKLMHTVIEEECNGCDLCIIACPVDCIDIRHLPKITDKAEQQRLAVRYRERYRKHQARLAPQAPPPLIPTPSVTTAPVSKPTPSPAVAAALTRTQLKKLEKQRQLAADNGESTQTLDQEIQALEARLASLS